MRFQIIKNTPKNSTKVFYSWRLLTSDGQLLARSRRYKSLEACEKDIHYVALSAVSISLDALLPNLGLGDKPSDAALCDVPASLDVTPPLDPDTFPEFVATELPALASE